MDLSNFESIRKDVDTDEMRKMVEDLWSLFKKDYKENDKTMFSQITYRIIYELDVWTENDSIKYATVCKRLMELNLEENKEKDNKEIISWLESESELASTIEQWFDEVASTVEED
ncbi:hypothetical protein ACSLGG_27135 [Bacillus mycoides]|uniref:hypothetical protein n=1 Tax=Bacillus mycoides TaxID=1405 RepID=UPI003F754AB4